MYEWSYTVHFSFYSSHGGKPHYIEQSKTASGVSFDSTEKSRLVFLLFLEMVQMCAQMLISPFVIINIFLTSKYISNICYIVLELLELKQIRTKK